MNLFSWVILITLIIGIFIAFTSKLKGPKPLVLTLALCFLFIMKIQQLLKGSRYNSNEECLITGQKKHNGVLYSGCVDIWHVSHFLFYVIIGLVYPKKDAIVWMVSVSWEIFEHFMFKYRGLCDDPFCLRYEDMILNWMGYKVGEYLTRYQ
jgi:hypothetical protein